MLKKRNTKKHADKLTQNLNDTNGNYSQMVLSPEEVEYLVYNLTNPDLCEESAQKLINYFSNFPYIYEPKYIKVLFEFYREENQQSDEVISLISEILISLFRYNKQNVSVLEVMKNENFYSLIWIYIDHIPSVMVLYKWLIKTFDCVFEYAMRNDICSKLSIIIYPESENTPILFELISSFARYTNYYCKFKHLIDAVSEMTFCTINLEVFINGITCIGEFTKRSIDFSIQICQNDKFFQFCSKLDQGRIFTFKAIVEFLDKTLQNRQICQESQNSKCGIEGLLNLLSIQDYNYRLQFEQCIYNIIKAAAKVIEQVQSKNCDESFLMPAVKAFSFLIYGPEIVKFYISSNIHYFLFEIAKNGNVAFEINVEVFRAICNLVSSSNLNEAKILIDMGFLSLVEDQIEMMIKLPNTTIDALIRIIDFSESYEEAKEWKTLIFENETIFSQLQFIIDHPDAVDEDNYCRDFNESASYLIQKRPNSSD